MGNVHEIQVFLVGSLVIGTRCVHLYMYYGNVASTGKNLDIAAMLL